MINLLKKSVDFTTIIKYILDLEVNLTVDKLLALALVTEKQLTKAIIKNETIKF